MVRNLPTLVVSILLLASCGGSPDVPPVADAGEDVRVPLGAMVVLDGRGSVDPNGSDLRYAWVLRTRPPSSGVSLVEADTAQPRFEPDVAGAYVAELTVDDGRGESTDDVRIEVEPNLAPVADAGEDADVPVGAEVRLDGSGSTDPEGAALDFAWSFESRPLGSVAAFDDAGVRRPRFVADQPGAYRVRLTTSDGGAKHSDTVEIYANRPPSAVASGPARAPVGQIVRLDGSASVDPDSDPLAYAWTLLSRPAGSVAVLEAAATASPWFEPDVVGRYGMELEVSDGRVSATTVVSVEVTSASGGAGDTVYVSPTTGDDGDAGTPERPLATLGAALTVTNGDEEVDRISLAEGSYDLEGYPYAITSDVSIFGPSGGASPAILTSTSANLLEVDGGVSLYLNRVTLRSSETALRVAAGASAELGEVTCEARTCIGSGAFLLAAGGRIGLTDSVLDGSTTAGDYGITVAHGTDVAVVRSRIEGFSEAGVFAFQTPVGLIDATLVGNGIGLRVNTGGESYGTTVSGGVFRDNGVGLFAQFAPRVNVTGSRFEAHADAAVELDGGASVVLDTVAIAETTADGVRVGGEDTDGEVLTMRDSDIGTDTRGVVVRGFASHADLGRENESGGNDIVAAEGLAILDARAGDAPGFITVSDTRLNGRYPKTSMFEGPDTYFEVTIEHDNDIFVY